jgi:hypothetical protein
MRAPDDATDTLEAITPEDGPCSDPEAEPAPPPAWVAPGAQRAELSTTFFRMIELPGSALRLRLAALWGAGASVEIGRCRLTGQPSPRGTGVVLRGRWRRPMHRTALPVEIELWPHLDRWTVVTLAPRRRVRLSRHYYKGGHHLLDALTAALDAA